MKNKTIAIVGLITCITVLHAQSVYSNSQNGSGKLAAVETVAYREILWTNGVFLPSIEGQTFAENNSCLASLSRAAESDLSVTNSDYQVIILSHDNEIPSITEGEVERVTATETKKPSVHGFTISEFLSWKYGTPRTNDLEQKRGAGTKKPVQNLFIEPLSAPKGNASDSSRFREYMLSESHPKPVWYEWFNPRVFIPKWTGFWMTETDATPVVLVMTTF